MLTLKYQMDGTTYEVSIVQRTPRLTLEIGNKRYEVEPTNDGTALINGDEFRFEHASNGDDCFLRVDGETARVTYLDPAAENPDAGADAGELRATMPGIVVEVHCAPGDSVSSGDEILTIESMKLQTRVTAPRAGVLAELVVQPGEAFEKDALLARLAPTDLNQMEE